MLLLHSNLTKKFSFIASASFVTMFTDDSVRALPDHSGAGETEASAGPDPDKGPYRTVQRKFSHHFLPRNFYLLCRPLIAVVRGLFLCRCG